MQGFQHEHQRSDRNKFITLSNENACVTSTAYSSMWKIMTADIEIPYSDYDYCSITHYAGASDSNAPCHLIPTGKVSCKIKDKLIEEVGKMYGLSPKDVTAINQRYGCKGYLDL